MNWLDRLAVPYQIVLTKMDKVSASEAKSVTEAVENTLKKHAAAVPVPVLTSAETKKGLDELRGIIASLR